MAVVQEIIMEYESLKIKTKANISEINWSLGAGVWLK